MSKNIWKGSNPTSIYSYWKRQLKSFLLQHFYHRLCINAIRWAGNPRLILKTDLWAECLDIDQLEGVDESLEICALDVSTSICETAKPVMLGRHIINADVSKLPFRSEIFDVLIDISTTDQISPLEASLVVSEYSRVLRQRGLLVIGIDSKLSLLWEMYRKLILRYPVYSWMPDRVKVMIAVNDFQIVRAFFGNSLIDSLIPQVERIRNPIWDAIFSTISQFYVVIARKSRHS
jgi:hypothetical protein